MIVNKRIAAALAAATTTAALATLGTATTAAASDGTAAAYPNAYYGTPKTGTGGLILRDRHGTPTSSGINEGTRFEFLGECVRAWGVRLVLVHQTEPGGWGTAYRGYVRRAFADLPPNMPC